MIPWYMLEGSHIDHARVDEIRERSGVPEGDRLVVVHIFVIIFLFFFLMFV